MSEAQKAEVTLYTTLEPYLMCLSAISLVGIRRVVYSALSKDGTEDVWIARRITIKQVNGLLVRRPLELVPGVLREEGIALLASISKQA